MDKELAGFGWYIKRIDNALAREACRNVQSHNLTMQQSHLLCCLWWLLCQPQVICFSCCPTRKITHGHSRS